VSFCGFFQDCSVAATALKVTGVKTVTKNANALKVPAALLMTVDVNVNLVGQDPPVLKVSKQIQYRTGAVEIPTTHLATGQRLVLSLSGDSCLGIGILQKLLTTIFISYLCLNF